MAEAEQPISGDLLTCIAVDDEPLALDIISDYAQKVPFLKLERTFSRGIDAMDFMRKNRVDLVFLDIQMPDLTGLQLLPYLNRGTQAILTTAYDHYAVRSYEFDVTDYLLKPIAFDRFLKAAHKAYANVGEKQVVPEVKESAVTAGADKASSGYMFVKSGFKTQRIDFDSILFVEAMKDYLSIHTTSGNIMTLMSFRQFEEQVPPGRFLRIHRSFMIQRSKIDFAERNMVSVNGRDLPVGESYRKQLARALGKGG